MRVDRSTAADGAELVAALAGDPEAFRRLTEHYRRELHLHCYRLLGSFVDAEDAVQETLLRAWRHLATFEGRSSFRAWLYRIATNVCLRQRQRQRAEPASRFPAVAEAIAASTEPSITLTPYPDALLDELEATSPDPAAEIDRRESVQLAFLAAVQLLPPRQRAVLILRDVLGFSTAEVADMLDSTASSVNSALARARLTLDHQRAAGRLTMGRQADPHDAAQVLARRYVEAWQAMDLGRLLGLLTRDVVLTMPPLPLRFSGREQVAGFFETIPVLGRDLFRFLPTRANRQPAMVAYRLDPERAMYQATGIWVLAIDGDAIAEITAFTDATLVRTFGLPEEMGLDEAARLLL
jgi:RNA polymerase sigma-70 factor (TIGR02960 family)